MNLDFAVLAEAAALGEGKLFIHGVPLKRLDVPQLPWGKAMAIAVSFDGQLDEAGNQHQLRFRIVGPTGDEILAAPPFPVVLPRREELRDDFEQLNALAVIELGLVGFATEGWYRIELSLDSELLETLKLRVVVNKAIRVIQPEAVAADEQPAT